MRTWAPSLTALVLIVAAALVVERMPWQFSPRGDFAPFAMTITAWNAARVGDADGHTVAGTSVFRLEYGHRDNWTITLVSDEVGGGPGVETPDAYACRNGVYGHLDAAGRLHPITGGYPCPGANRWIAFGMATAVPWDKSTSGGVVTYTNSGERVSFDLSTGFPLMYEAGLGVDGTAKTRTTYVVERR
jgi:hypothetical protein